MMQPLPCMHCWALPPVQRQQWRDHFWLCDISLHCNESEQKCVVVFNFLHCGLCCQGELDDGIVVQLVPARSTLARIRGLPVALCILSKVLKAKEMPVMIGRNELLVVTPSVER